jgi:MoaA/NifB/PqqE/SkfB family radical SAM enzyme
LTMTIPKMLEEIREEGIKAIVEDSYYLSGAYDWAIILTVEDNRDLIRFMELWRKHYGEYFSRVIQSEVMFISTRNSKLNPNLSEIGNLLK